MRWTEIGDETGTWQTLETYRDRYDIENDLTEIERLRRSIDRRHGRWMATRKRLTELEEAMTEARSQLMAIETEVARSRSVGRLLIDDLLERSRISENETWSPVPVLGYRAWEITPAGVHGARILWESPTMGARCLNRVEGEDLPHSTGRCGPPACGVYSTKDLDSLMGQFGLHDRRSALLGVVSLRGKVIEHHLGYRAARATVVAMAAWVEGRILVTDSPSLIEAIFDPQTTSNALTAAEPNMVAPPVRAVEYLTQWKEESEKWTWEPRFESSR